MARGLLALTRAVLDLAPRDSRVGGCGLPANTGRSLLEDLSDLEGILDHGDHFCSLAMGARTALTLYDAHSEWAAGTEGLEEDQSQDLVVRLLALSIALQRLAPGAGVAELLGWTWGQSLLWWLAAVDLGLSFGTEDDPVEPGHAAGAVESFLDEAQERLEESELELGAAALAGVAELAACLDDLVGEGMDLGGLAEAVREHLPELGGNSAEDLIGEAEANPVLGLLLSRLAAEVRGAPIPAAEPEPEAEPEAPSPPATPQEAEERLDAVLAELRRLRVELEPLEAPRSTLRTVQGWCRQNREALERVQARSSPLRQQLNDLGPLDGSVGASGQRVKLQHLQNQSVRAGRKLARAGRKLEQARERVALLRPKQLERSRARLVDERAHQSEALRLARLRLGLARMRRQAMEPSVEAARGRAGELRAELGALGLSEDEVDVGTGRMNLGHRRGRLRVARRQRLAAHRQRAQAARRRFEAHSDCLELAEELVLLLRRGQELGSGDGRLRGALQAELARIEGERRDLPPRDLEGLEALEGRLREARKAAAKAARLQLELRVELASARALRSEQALSASRLRVRVSQARRALQDARLAASRSSSDRVLRSDGTARSRLAVARGEALVGASRARRAELLAQLSRARMLALQARLEALEQRRQSLRARLDAPPEADPQVEAAKLRRAQARVRRGSASKALERAKTAVRELDERAEEIEDRYENSIRRAGVLQRQVTGTESRLDDLRYMMRGARPSPPPPAPAPVSALPELPGLDEAKTTVMTPEAIAALKAELLGGKDKS